MKKKNAKFRVSEKPTIMGTPGLDYITLGLVDAEKLPKYELTKEDGMKLAKEYSRVLMRKHRARQAAETNLLRMKKEAIEALPGGLKEVIIYYLYSEANKCANFLENLGCHGGYSLIFHEQCPLEVRHLFLVDKCFV